METFTRQQSLEAFLPSRVAALPHAVEMIDAFAMRLDEAALQAARRRNWKRAGAFISDVQCDILSLAGAAKDEEAKTLRTIGFYVSQQRLFHAVAQSDDLEAFKVLSRWSERNQAATTIVPHLLSRAATNGRVEMLEFAVEKAVERLSPELAMSKGAGTTVWDTLCHFLDASSGLVQDWFHKAFLQALNGGQHHIADLLYVSLSNPQRLNLFYYLARNDSTAGVNYVLEVDAKCTLIRSKVILRAFNDAVYSSSCNVLQVLLKWGDFSLQKVALAFETAARAGAIDVAREIYETERVPQSVLIKVYKKAVGDCMKFEDEGTIELVKFLVGGDDIPGELIQSAFVHAVHARSVCLVHELCRSRYAVESRMFRAACINRQREVVKFLCSTEAVLASEELLDAIRSDSLLVANYLWGQAWTSRVNCINLFIDSARMGEVKVVEWFCNHGRASRDVLTTAFIAGVDAGRLGVTKRLYDKQRASPEVMAGLMKRACKLQHFKVLDFLLQNQ